MVSMYREIFKRKYVIILILTISSIVLYFADTKRDLLRAALRRGRIFWQSENEDIFENIVKKWPKESDIRRSLDKNSENYPKSMLERIVDEYINKSTHFPLKPKDIKFQQNMRGNCWRKGQRQLCLPNFYIASFPKSATTDLWEKMVIHPNIAPTCGKEPNWWAASRYTRDKTFEDYVDCLSAFPKTINNESIIGDASPDSLWLNVFMGRKLSLASELNLSKVSDETRQALLSHQILPLYLAHRYTPAAKFIIIMRNPVDRLYAGYNHMRHYLHLDLQEKGNRSNFTVEPTSPENFHQDSLKLMKMFTNCLQTKDVRECSYDEPLVLNILQIRLYVGFYIVYIRDFLRVVPRKNVHFINFNRYVTNRRQEIEKVYRFLGISRLPGLQKFINQSSIAMAHQQKILPMWNKTRRSLEAIYRPFNIELANFLNDSSFLFYDSNVK